MISGYEISSLKKGLQILDLLKEKRYMKLIVISVQLELNKTTFFRLLHTLRRDELHPKG
ncbi:helix-turn-helix domain-containing protein [Paenibacillus glacialis]|uniref:helix-turn-helix domain-containing protein n=1 Tax=Paenibacillus glacialis TaxID=494026 RepID=UPI000A057F12